MPSLIYIADGESGSSVRAKLNSLIDLNNTGILAYLPIATAATTYTPLSRELTINGTTYDLSANRSWTIATGGNETLAQTLALGNTSGAYDILMNTAQRVGFKDGNNTNTSYISNNQTTAGSRTAYLPLFDGQLAYHATGVPLISGRVTYATTNGALTDNSLFVFDGTNLGIGTATPSAKLHVASTSGTTLRTDGALNNTFVVNHSGAVSFGAAVGSNYFSIKDILAPDSDRKILSVTDSLGNEAFYLKRSTFYSYAGTHTFSSSTLNFGYYYQAAGSKIFFNNTGYGGAHSLQVDVSITPIFSSPLTGYLYYDVNNLMYKDRALFFGLAPGAGPSANGTWRILTPNTTQADATFEIQRYDDYTNPQSKFKIDTLGNVGVGQTTITARLHVTGSTSDSSAYALKVDNSSSSALLYVRNDGLIIPLDGGNIQLGTTTGTKIGTATTQKIGFWNATPIVQPTTGVAASTLVGGGGTTLTDTDTFDGYTVKQIVKALRDTGLLA